MTAAEFEAAYAERSGLTVDELHSWGRFAEPCDCKPKRVHVVSCAYFNGPIPKGWEVDHVWDRGCRHKACFNPFHLEAVTPEEHYKRPDSAGPISHARAVARRAS